MPVRASVAGERRKDNDIGLMAATLGLADAGV